MICVSSSWTCFATLDIFFLPPGVSLRTFLRLSCGEASWVSRPNWTWIWTDSERVAGETASRRATSA